MDKSASQKAINAYNDAKRLLNSEISGMSGSGAEAQRYASFLSDMANLNGKTVTGKDGEQVSVYELIAEEIEKSTGFHL